MKLVVQRVNFANVSVNGEIVGSINKGLLVFLGVSCDYLEEKLDYMADKLLKLRLWGSDRKGFDISVKDVSGEILVISQFTLFGDCRKGTKPNFAKAAKYDVAEDVYNRFILKLKESGLKVESGSFGAMMKINSENDGPVTIILEK